MEDRIRQKMLDKVRENYKMLYIWHKQFGLSTFREKFGKHMLEYEKAFNEYQTFLDQMSNPQNATVDIMKRSAEETLFGCMEWSYSERYNQIELNRIAKIILELLEGNVDREKEIDYEKELKKLRNIGEGQFLEPSFVEIETNSDIRIENYIEYSKVAYSDVTQRVNNVGGMIALSDTNWEQEKQMLHNREGRLRFRNSKAMHFEEIKNDESLSELAKSGLISILSIKIGG